jgi:hypothetical protein
MSHVETGTVEDPAALVRDRLSMLGEGVAALVYRHDAVVAERTFTGSLPEAENLLELRLFSAAGELRVWRSGEGLRYRLRTESGGGTPAECFDQTHLTWDDRRSSDLGVPRRYTARTYVEYDDDGIARFVDARLTAFEY